MFKRLIDVLGSVSALIVFSPFLVVLPVLIKLSSSGPVFFVQERIGLRGTIYRMLKFRSMTDGSEKSGTGLFTFKGDPRITPVGHFIRKTSLDELPQLLNVLKGNMSLVGPRSPVTYELGPWEGYTEHMKKRFEVKPGITGLAQISGRNELDWDTKIEFDNQYVDLYEKWGVLIDLKILFLTCWVVVVGRDTVEPTYRENEGPVACKAREVMESE